jgi:transcriptional regulator with XRE-family HTH domain
VIKLTTAPAALRERAGGRANMPARFPSVGRVLRTLRLAALISIEAAAAAARVTPARMRELERGRDLPTFFEADGLVKLYLLCASCFGRHLRAGAARDGAIESASVALLAVLNAADEEAPDEAHG